MDLDHSTLDLSQDTELVRFALDQTDAGLFCWDYRKDEQVWCGRVRRLFGVDTEFMVTAEQFLTLVHCEDVASLLDDIARSHDPESDTAAYTLQFRVQTAAGLRWIRIQSQLERNAEGKVICERGIVTDVTQSFALEDQLHSALQRADVGRLASGIAHDFNNLLASILGEVSLCRLESELSPTVQACLDSIDSVTDRASHLARQLLTSGRPYQRAPINIDLNHVISDLQRPLERILGLAHRLQVELVGGNLPVYADLNQLGQVVINLVINLVINARDASPTGNTITVRTVRSEIDGAAWASIEVRDQGHGISEDLHARVFDPYFTTKPKGTGLGLASSREIIERYSGRLELESYVGRGTTVSARLPLRAVEGDSQAVIPTRRSTKIPLVLVIDDDPRGLELAHRALSPFDLTPISALEATRALQLAREHRDELGLVVTTLQTPGLDTREFRHRLKAVCPNTPVLFFSESASIGDIRLDDVIYDGDGFLLKPSTTFSLSRKVQDLLRSD